MRHRQRGRVLGRSPSHRRALLRNLASALFLTERDAELDGNAPKVPGRITTTLQKAKEVRPLVEKCITIAKKGVEAERQAEEFATDAERGSDAWKQWRESDRWQQWVAARAPAVAARRRVLQLIRDKQAVGVLFDVIAERFIDRPGGYTRVVRLATPRLGDAGTQAILELVGKNDRVGAQSERPAFAADEDDQSQSDADAGTGGASAEQESAAVQKEEAKA